MKDLSDSVVNVGINDCYTFSYTSGTTGPPKGAMIAHRNMLDYVNTFSQHQDLRFNKDDRYLSYLPLPPAPSDGKKRDTNHVLQRCLRRVNVE